MILAPVESFDPDYFAVHGYPHAAWAWMRANAPVAWSDVPGREPFWAITRHAEIVEISRDSQRAFVSSPGVTIRRTAMPSSWSAIPLLLTMDPPQHGQHRAIVRDHFRPRAMAALHGHIIERCRAIADKVAAARLEGAQGEAVDFVRSVAMRLPLDVILALIGVPADDREQMYRWSNAVVGADDPDHGDAVAPQAAILTAREEIFAYFKSLIAERRASPREDLITHLVEARIDGAALTDLEILGHCFVLMIAGNETTRSATSAGLLTLFEHPEQMARLVADPALMPGAVEELLRWTAPVVYMARTATRDVTIAGQSIAAGDKVVMFYPSANRDAAVFADPDRFDIGRTPNEHLTFGYGRHHCLGAELARIELAAVVGEILRRFPNIRPAGQPVRLRSNLVGGIKSMPVDFGEPAISRL